MIIVVIRLGAEKTEPKLKPMLIDLFKMKYFNGMIGGKPTKALYFVGVDDEELVYLDPHYVQPSTSRKTLPSQL